VTPDGEVVWEVYGPWQPYDAERLGTRDESSPRAMADYGTTGVVELESEPVDTTDVEACYEHLLDVERTRLVPEDDPGVKTRSVVDRDGTERDTSNGDGTDDGMNGDGTDSGGSATATRETTETEDGLLGSPAADTGPDATVIGAASVVLLAAVALGVLAWRQRG
jgi:hypothetical protein